MNPKNTARLSSVPISDAALAAEMWTDNTSDDILQGDLMRRNRLNAYDGYVEVLP